jgi:FG-GAP-like repeat
VGDRRHGRRHIVGRRYQPRGVEWRSDGTPGGTFPISASGVAPAAQLGGIAFTPPIQRDFDGDLRSNYLWQNTSGEVAIWNLNGTSVSGSANFGHPGPSWHVKATGDFNGDARADILWQYDSGEVVIWELNVASVIGSASFGNRPDLAYLNRPLRSDGTLEFGAREQLIDQRAGRIPIVGPIAMAAADKPSAGIEHLILGMARAEFRADRVPGQLEELDTVARRGGR